MLIDIDKIKARQQKKADAEIAKLENTKRQQAKAFRDAPAKQKASKPVYDLDWFLIDLKATLLKGCLESRNIDKVLEYVKKYSRLVR